MRIFIQTFGCQMNVRDSEVIYGLLQKEGYKITDEPQKADIILFNTCSVRQRAEDKAWSEVGRIAKIKGQSPAGTVPIIGIVGCMAQNYKQDIFTRAPNVDFAVGPSDIHKIPGILKNIADLKLKTPCLAGRQENSKLFEKKIYETEGDIRPEGIYHTGFYRDKEHAYVVISEGCSNYCSYCIVPHVRGELKNRNYKDILREIEEAAQEGITKITLLGQNVNAYKDDGINFVELLKQVNIIKGLKEYSFITSHPKDTTGDLFKAMADLDRLKKYLHLPVQSGSDRILKLMNRGYTRKTYIDLIESYRNIVKEGVLTTDIIVGFPTETEEDFQDTYDLAKDICFDAAYIFKYSVRPNTEAQKLLDDVSKREKERRHKVILDLQKKMSRDKSKNNVKFKS